MTRPLQTPSGMPSTTPIPRMPDGSPVPRAKARELRAKEAARTAYPDVPDHDPYKNILGPLDPDVADERLRAEEEAERIEAPLVLKNQSKPLLSDEEGLAVTKAAFDDAEKAFNDGSFPTGGQVATTTEADTITSPESRKIEVGPEFEAELEREAAGQPVSKDYTPTDDQVITEYKPASVPEAEQVKTSDTDITEGETDEAREEREFQEELLKEAMTTPTPAKAAPAKKANPRQPAKKAAPKPAGNA